jgi:hypothetical protein
MNYINRLLEFAGRFSPVFQPGLSDWHAIETYLGIEFSADYKSLTGMFGFGWFGRIEISNPAAPESRRLSVENLKIYKRAVERSEKKMMVHFFPHPNGLICFGRTGTGVDLCLRPPLKKDPVWIVVTCDFDLEHHFEFRMEASEFLFKVYTGNLKSKWLDDFRKFVWPSPHSPIFKPAQPLAFGMHNG